MPKIGIVGAGPGGLTTAMILARKGFDVTLFERSASVGGRTSSFNVGHSKFDLGPTFLMMKFVLDKCFEDAGKKSSDYMKFQQLNPMYRLQYNQDQYMDCYDVSQKDKMIQEMKRMFPEDVKGYEYWIDWETKRYEKLIPLLQGIYNDHSDLINMNAVRALKYMQFPQSLHKMLGGFYENPLTKLSFSFQAKYLGMSPWECPAFYGKFLWS